MRIWIKSLLVITACIFSFTLLNTKYNFYSPSVKLESAKVVYKIDQAPFDVRLDVPLLNQMDAPALFNGCEVTSLAMLLQFSGKNVTKNQLAHELPTTPIEQNGQYGNPDKAFVGSISGANSPGLGVNHAPIAKLATKYIDKAHIHDITGSELKDIVTVLSTGAPVWIITTTDYQAPKNWQTVTTKEGKKKITYSMHSVVITGYDKENFYINDPYGHKNRAVKKSILEEGWTAMGKQAIYLSHP
ncbi:C39 family peptidase [Listeria seeligeri]|uniref:C39 family peptidase n=1 Tax=Listeria seeligeri TaxID=1640 RepID=UPI0022EAD79F|nr:C39 family peptidase [Listeria seeligeri]